MEIFTHLISELPLAGFSVSKSLQLFSTIQAFDRMSQEKRRPIVNIVYTAGHLIIKIVIHKHKVIETCVDLSSVLEDFYSAYTVRSLLGVVQYDECTST